MLQVTMVLVLLGKSAYDFVNCSYKNKLLANSSIRTEVMEILHTEMFSAFAEAGILIEEGLIDKEDDRPKWGER